MNNLKESAIEGSESSLRKQHPKPESYTKSRFGLVVLLLIIYLLFSLAIASHALESKLNSDSDKTPSEMRMKVRKCCQIGKYFDVTRNKCEPWTSPQSFSTLNGTLWFSTDKTKGTWRPHPFYWDSFSPKTQPILNVACFLNISRFDSKFVGAPPCSTGKEEDVRTVVVNFADHMMIVGDDKNSSRIFNWDHDWENETNYFFQPDNGVLVEVSPNTYKETYHNKEQFCVDLSGTLLILRICHCTEKQPCIRKCCSAGMHLKYNWTDPDYHSCVPDGPTEGNYTLPIHHSKTGTPLSPHQIQVLQPRYIVSAKDERLVDNVDCDFRFITSGWSVEQSIRNSFIIHKSGLPRLFDEEKKSWEVVMPPYTDHCIDKLDGDSALGVCPAEPEVLLICFASRRTNTRGTSSQPHIKSEWVTVFTVALVISTIFLLITVIVLSCLLKKNNIHSWTRLAYLLSHFLFFLLLGLTHVKVVTPFISLFFCKTTAVLIHFTGLATACWLSVINFDLWWTFKVLEPRSRDKLDVPRFLWYICFALGLPLFIIIIGLIIQSQEPEHMCRTTSYNFISPNYGGARKCSLSAAAMPVYWFGPLFALLLANLIFFCSTTCRMFSLQRTTRRASIESTNGQTQIQKIFIKIFIVSGVTWWVEIIDWIFKGNSGAWYWYLADMVHFVQAIALFVIFVCKRDVIRSLQIKYPVITKIIPPVSGPHASRTRSSFSTDTKSRVTTFANTLIGRKFSTASTASSGNSDNLNTNGRRQENIELPPIVTSASWPAPASPTSVQSPGPSYPNTSDPDPKGLHRKESSSSTNHVQVHKAPSHYVERDENDDSYKQ